LFRVSTLDLANLPRTPEGKIDFAQVFFGREAFLTVSGQLNVEAYCLAMDVLAPGSARSSAAGSARNGSTCWPAANFRNAWPTISRD
jgi:asparaginyl-tRNA synthetase